MAYVAWRVLFMNKKIWFLAGILAICSAINFCWGAQNEGDYDPITITSVSFATNNNMHRAVLFNFPGPGKRNCITDISASSSNFPPAGYSLVVLDGLASASTAYTISQSSMAIIESWYKEFPLCLSPGASTYIYVSTGSWNLNASGFVKPR